MNIIRDRKLDILKGIAIILIVIGHTKFQGNHYVYLFHVAIFFMMSGLLYNEKKINNKSDVKDFIVKRIKRLYIPYVIINIICILFNNFFININIYSLNTNHYLSIKEGIIEILKTLLFCGNAEIIGATWFLRILFFISLLYCFIEIVTRNIKYKQYIHIIIAIILYFIGIQLTQLNNGIILFAPIFTCYLLYAFGNIYLKKVNEFIEKNNDITKIIILTVSLISLYLLGKIGTIEISQAKYTNLIYFSITSFIGWIIIYILSSYLSKLPKLSKVIEYIGKSTISILFLHFAAFKLVTYCLIKINQMNIDKLSSFPVLNIDNEYYWIIYTIFGIAIPLLLDFIYKNIKNKILERRRDVEIRSSNSNI